VSHCKGCNKEFSITRRRVRNLSIVRNIETWQWDHTCVKHTVICIIHAYFCESHFSWPTHIFENIDRIWNLGL
jgi:hypothetical protein